MATVNAVDEKARKKVPPEASTKDIIRKDRFPKDLINLGANKNRRVLPRAPTRRMPLTMFELKNPPKRDELT